MRDGVVILANAKSVQVEVGPTEADLDHPMKVGEPLPPRAHCVRLLKSARRASSSLCSCSISAITPAASALVSASGRNTHRSSEPQYSLRSKSSYFPLIPRRVQEMA